MRRYKVTDTITYERTWFVEAHDEDHALDLAIDHGPTDDGFEEEQIDNTPYEIEEVGTEGN